MGAPAAEIFGPLDRVEHIMGMPIGVEVRDPDVDPGALDAAFDWFRWVDATFSTYKADSEVSRLNRGELALADAHPEVRAVLARCQGLYSALVPHRDPEISWHDVPGSPCPPRRRSPEPLDASFNLRRAKWESPGGR